MEHITREEAYDLLKKYNKDPFHIQHALTVEAVMKWYAEQLGWELDKLLTMTLEAMKATEDEINAEIEKKKKQRFGRKHPNLYYFAINRTPSVPGPQWLDTTPPALVSNISWKTPRLSRYERTDSTVAASQPECVMNTRSGLAAFKSVSISFT